MIFKVGGCVGTMPDATRHHSFNKSVLLVTLFLISLCSPLLSNPSGMDELTDEPEVSLNAPFTLTSGYGHDLAGTAVNIDGLQNAVVREESMLDYWISSELNNSSFEHHGTPDMELTRHFNEHYCWATEEGSVRTAIHRPDGAWSSTLVDTVAASSATDLVDCALGVTSNELPRVLYADGDDLKMGRYAMQSATYWDGARWHTRTIMEDVYPTHLELDITPEGLEWGLMRTASGALHQVNFSGAYWTTYLLDAGPVGLDMELEVDATGVAHVLYSRNATGQVVLLRIDGFDRDTRILLTDEHLADSLGMDLDTDNIEQVATATQDGTSFSLNLIRSLAGQDTGRVDPAPNDHRIGEEDATEGDMLLADLNADGFDDLIVSTPDANLLSHSHNGRVDVYYGSSTGLSIIPDEILAGEADGELFGAGVAVGDFNDDGIHDLAVGAPGWQSSGAATIDGRLHVYLGNASGLSSTPWSSISGATNESLGSTVVALHQAGMPDALAVVAQNYSIEISQDQTDYGKVNLYAGHTQSLVHERNLTQSKKGDLFGRSLEACDINNDGHDELLVGNTGSFEVINSFSSVEYFYGSPTGYNGTPDHTLESIVSGQLLGMVIACVGDVNGDGYEDHLLTEPFNSTQTFGGGMLWLYYGTTGALPNEADLKYAPSINNARVGEDIAPAGDINEDGYDDVFISSRLGNAAGQLEIFLGSSTGLQTEPELLAQGNSSEHLGLMIASNGDINADGLSEVVYSKRNLDHGENHRFDYLVLSERDWESIDFPYAGTLGNVELATAARGETSMVFSHADTLRTHVSKLEHMNDGTPSGQWVHQTISSMNSTSVSICFDVRSSGQPVIVIENSTSIQHHTTTSMTAVEQDVATTGTMGQYLGSTINHDGEQVLAYTSGAGQQIYLTEQTQSGWNTGLVRGSVGLASDIEVLVDQANTPHLVYRHDATDQLELAIGGSSWSLTSLGAAGEALSVQHPSVMLNNDTVAVALVESDGTGTNLALWMHDGTTLSKQIIANQSQTDVELSLAVLANGSLLVALLTSNGLLEVYEQWPSSSTWYQHTVAQPNGVANEFRLDLKGGTTPVLALRGNALSPIMMLNESNVWNTVAERPAAAIDGAWDVLLVDEHLLLLTSDAVSNHLVVNTLEMNSLHEGQAPWMTVRFGDVLTTSPVDAVIDGNGTIHMAYWDQINNDVIALRLYEDEDRDLVFDLIDGMPTVGDQWKNSDGDNYGDNPLGPMPDICPTVSGASSFIEHGCDDYDTDGFRDTIDACDEAGGTSWIDRFGCEDLDQDGWSDNGASYFDGDVYKGNWKQALDTDGDGFGDNHGVDCCATAIDPNANQGDLFPYFASQYIDTDGDGWGDNDTDTVHGDYCPWDFGTSYRDRNGCLDSDGDGASDPSDQGTIFEWNETAGADVWPLDPTQWKDSDGDGFGDNQSENATAPDRFPLRKVAANDTDNDGYADNWTAFASMDDDNDGIINLNDLCVDSNTSLPVGENGCDEEQELNNTFPKSSYKEGIELDACPTEWGNSTRRNLTINAYGCLDSDGDSYTDAYAYEIDEFGFRYNELGDAFPQEKTQFRDKDGDGFGDNPTGINGDQCPNEAGVEDGTPPSNSDSGVGCRLIDQGDTDGDGLINELDTLCPNTPQGEPVNEQGCSPSELDDDNDGVKNNLDLCPETPSATAVDTDGCSTEQRTSDSDGDGVNDPEDDCPNTASGEIVDANGCAQSQRDTDGDGISDLDDACDDTPTGFPILPNGCTDEAALDEDLDGDGYKGAYTYTTDPDTGEIISEQGDAFPSDPTQWFDRDGDGYGDNAEGNNADACPDETGTSYIDYLGCFDDGDGWRDANELPYLQNNPTQWKDTDLDGFGDNWGDETWTAGRDPSWPGQFVEGATNADFCPLTEVGWSVDDKGCHISQLDSDNDGVMDDSDNCPNEPKGADGYDDGCPYVPLSSGEEDGLFGLDAGTIMVVLGGGGLLLVVGGLVVLRMMREDDDEDDEDDYDDFFDDEEEEESFLDTLDRRQATSLRSGNEGTPTNTSPVRSRTQQQTSGGPTSKPKSGGPPKRTPVRSAPATAKKQVPAQKVAKKKSVSGGDEAPTTKVRKAKINVDMSIFEDWQEDDRTSAVEWVVGAFADNEQERTVLMQLQETGWTAEQSRAICNLAKNKSA